MSFDYQKICATLYREARLLDDRQWDDWLARYAGDVTYWMPAWTTTTSLSDDHESQISLMYYPDRGGPRRPRVSHQDRTQRRFDARAAYQPQRDQRGSAGPTR